MPEKNAVEEEYDISMVIKDDPLYQMNQDISLMSVFGIYQQGSDMALFFERGKEVLIIRENDVIDGKYRVTNVTHERITLRSDSLDQEVDIDIREFN